MIDDNDAVMTAKICEPIYESSNISTMLILYMMDLLSRIKSYLFSKPCDEKPEMQSILVLSLSFNPLSSCLIYSTFVDDL